MNKPLTALLLTSALLIPAAPAVGWGMPDLPGGDPNAEGEVCCASNSEPSVFITDCFKTRHGVTARIRIRDEGSRGRVRVSHPQGEGKFREPRVRSVDARMVFSGDPQPPAPDGSAIGSGVAMQPYGDRPSFRTSTRSLGNTDAVVTFKLRNGKSFNMACRMR